MKTDLHVRPYVAQFISEREMFQTKVAEKNKNIHLYVQ